MRTWMTVTTAVLAISILPAAVSRTEAGPLGGRMWQGHGGAQAARTQIADLEQQLNLSEDQKTQIQSIMAQERRRAVPLVLKLMQDRKAMQSAASAPGTFDESQVRTAAAEQAQTITDLMVEAERVKSQVSAILTPDQRVKFAQLMDQKRSQLRQRFSGTPTADAAL
jgi:Spy/CpxP family protein refolding chaperone